MESNEFATNTDFIFNELNQSVDLNTSYSILNINESSNSASSIISNFSLSELSTTSSGVSIGVNSPSPIQNNSEVKKVLRKRKTAPRSRRACDNCRLKKIKCDALKPSCSRCRAKSLPCNYTLKLQFKYDVEKNGKRFGREGINSTTRITTNDLVQKSKLSYYKPISNKSNLQYVHFFNEDITKSEKLAFKLFPSLQSSIIPKEFYLSTNSNNLDYALNFYIHFISPILNPVGDQSIQYKQVENEHNKNTLIVVEKGLDLNSLVKYSSHNEYLFKFIMSLGSIYLAKYLNNRDWLIQSQKFQEEGLNQIKPMIEQLINEEEIDEIQTDLLIALVLLILYEFANDCSKKWIIYLRLCKKIIQSKSFKIPKNSLEFSLLKFCLEFLDYQESMGRTACKDVNLFFTQLIKEEEEVDENLISLVSWMGCDKRLLPIISDITDLSFERFKKSINEKDYFALCEDMRTKLENMNINMIENQIKPNGELSNQSFDVEEVCFLLSCEVKRLSTILYLECCLLNSTPEDEVVESLVETIFKYLEFIVIKNDYKWYSTLIWSTFMAASEISVISSNCENLRYLTLSIFDKLEKNTLGNIRKTKQIVIDIWKRRDLDNSNLHSTGYIDITSRKFRKRKKLMGFINDWEKYVVDEDYAIALA
ncbi:unnamed protein product [Candida verbasci]|uniref:Zn(2)-C6 fungal-type domain-containing protein n=1 Tax=Candida verbasci TaxID=1227364 RepID=A0A9W4TV00_9ASCO|nr:unnamed protein product [Candida verbasci]